MDIVFRIFDLIADKPMLASVVLFVGLVYAFIIIQNPFWGIMGYLTLYYAWLAERFTILAQIRSEFLVAALTGFAWVMRLSQQPRLFLEHPVSRGVIALVAAMCLSVPMSIWKSDSVYYILDFLKTIAVFILVAHLVDTFPKLRGFLWIYCMLVFYQAAHSFYIYLTGQLSFDAQGMERLRGLGTSASHPNALAANVALSIPILTGLVASEQKRILKLFVLGVIALDALVILRTGSRTGILAMGLIFFVIWLRSPHKMILLMLAIMASPFFWIYLPDEFKERVFSIGSAITGEGRDASAQARITVWMHGLEMFLQRPLFGYGINQYVFYSIEHYGITLRSHSVFIQILAEMGIVGFAAFSYFIFVIFRSLSRVYQRAVENGKKLQKYMPGQRLNSRKASVEREKWMPLMRKNLIFQNISINLMLCYGVLLFTGIFGHNLGRLEYYSFAGLVIAIAYLSSNFDKELEERIQEEEEMQPGADDDENNSDMDSEDAEDDGGQLEALKKEFSDFSR